MQSEGQVPHGPTVVHVSYQQNCSAALLDDARELCPVSIVVDGNVYYLLVGATEGSETEQ